jgi:phenylpyruvate tautomerase PptA (4-oxalocrotonate tautomerase family)
MPLVRISLRRGKTPAYKLAIMNEVYEAMREAFDVPENDRFMTVSEHGAEEFAVDRHYLGIERSDDVVIIQITANNTRTTEKKKALYRRIADRLAVSPGVRREDVFINLVEVAKENWSFGNGEAQYA